MELGDFTAELYFGIDRVLTGDDERFLYKRKCYPIDIITVLFYTEILLVFRPMREKKIGWG